MFHRGSSGGGEPQPLPQSGPAPKSSTQVEINDNGDISSIPALSKEVAVNPSTIGSGGLMAQRSMSGDLQQRTSVPGPGLVRTGVFLSMDEGQLSSRWIWRLRPLLVDFNIIFLP